MTRRHETILNGGQEARLSSPPRRSTAPTGASLGRRSGEWLGVQFLDQAVPRSVAKR